MKQIPDFLKEYEVFENPLFVCRYGLSERQGWQI